MITWKRVLAVLGIAAVHFGVVWAYYEFIYFRITPPVSELTRVLVYNAYLVLNPFFPFWGELTRIIPSFGLQDPYWDLPRMVTVVGSGVSWGIAIVFVSVWWNKRKARKAAAKA